MLSACMRVSIHISPSNFWASCLTLITAGRRSETLTSLSSCKSSGKRAPGLRGGRPNYGPQADKACNPGSPLDSKGSNMSHKTKRDEALPVLLLVVASRHSSKSHREPWPPTKQPTPPGPAALPSGKGLNSPRSMKLLAQFYKEQLFQKESNTTTVPSCTISAR